MGFRDVEMRKFNKELKMKSRDRDLLKEAEQQEGIMTSTTGLHKSKEQENPEQKSGFKQDLFKKQGFGQQQDL